VWDGSWLYGVDAWHPDGGQYVGYWCDANPCATPGLATVLNSGTGRVLLKPRDIVDGDGDIFSLAYVDEGRNLMVADSDGRTLIVDAETLRARGKPFDILADCCATPIGDGSTAMVYEWTADGTSTLWRVLDIGDGEVRSEGRVDPSPPRTARRSRWRATPAKS
jgi:hypothetical protein